MKIHKIVYVILSIVIIAILIILIRALDSFGFSAYIASGIRDSNVRSFVANTISSAKWLLYMAAGFIVGSWDKLYNVYEKHQNRIKEDTPEISICILYASISRRMPPTGAEEIIYFDEKSSRHIYLKCQLTNQGNTDLLALMIGKKLLNCPRIKKGESYCVHFGIGDHNKQCDIQIEAQNSRNEWFEAKYRVKYVKNNAPIITCERRFKRNETDQ